MDAKKTNLTPELKEIYDRVMNTKGTPVSGNGALPTSVPPATQPISPPPPNTSPGIPQPAGITPEMPSVGTPPPAVAPQMPSSPNMGAPVMPPEMPIMGQPMGTNAEQALTSTPARPISEGNTFSFNGGSIKQKPAAQAADGTKKKAKISLPVLLVLGFVFIVVWGVFWAIVLGLIQR